MAIIKTVNPEIMKKYILLTFLLLCIVTMAKAQTSNTLYYMMGVPQSTWLNPAMNPHCGFSTGFAGNFNISNNFISMSDILKQSGDSTITLLGSPLMQQQFKDNFKSNSNINLNADFGWHWGMRIGNLNVALEIWLNSYTRDYFTGGLFDFAINPNGSQNQFDIGGLNINHTTYAGAGLRAAYEVTSQLTVGARVKRIYGIANINSNTNLSLTTSPEQLKFNGSIDYQFAVVGLDIGGFGETDEFDSLDFSTTRLNDELKAGNATSIFTQNKGFGFDFGAVYRFTENLEVGASVVDLGSIKWNEGTYRIKYTGSFNQEAVDVSLNDTASSGFDNIANDIIDTILNSDNIIYSQAPYRTWLPTRLYLSGRYKIGQRIGLGLVSRTIFANNKIQQGFTGSVNLFPLRGLSLTSSYSVMNRTHSMGFGVNVTALPFLPLIIPPYIYFVVDNIPAPFTWPKISSVPDGGGMDWAEGRRLPVYQMQAISFMVGVNWKFGCRFNKRNKESELKKDEPLFYY